MIFRRTNDLSSSQNSNSANSRAPSATQTRREPEVNQQRQTTTGNSPAAPTTLTPTLPQTGTNRRQQAPSASSFNRPEQMRKLTVGRDISLNGEIATCDHLIVEGNVSATIKGGQILEISETGTFSGLVDIDQADIGGVFDGELTVRGKLILRPTAVVTGLVRYGRLQVDAGATLNGQISALPASATETSSTTAPAASTQTGTTSSTSYSSSSLASVNDQPGFLKASA